MENNELIEVFRKLFGEVVSKEIEKYEYRKTAEAEYSDDVKALKRIIEKTVEDSTGIILKEISDTRKEILEKLIEIQLSQTQPLVPNTWKPDIEPIWPYGPVVTRTTDKSPESVTQTTTVDNKAENLKELLTYIVGI